MRRREFITVVAGVTVAGAVAGRAQQPGMPVIGYLSYTSAEFEAPALLPAFRRGLREIGFVEDQNVTIEYRWAEFEHERLAQMATDLVGSGRSFSDSDCRPRRHTFGTCRQGGDLDDPDCFPNRH